jgi:hypothetical protein
MPVATATPQAAPVSMQGIAIPAAVVDKNAFFARTRRHIQQEKQPLLHPRASPPGT